MKITVRDILGYHEIQGEILSSSRNTVTVRLTSPVSGPTGTFFVPINYQLLEDAIPYAQAGLLSLYEDFKEASLKRAEYRYLLRPFFGKPYRYENKEDYYFFKERMDHALTSKYLPGLVECARHQPSCAEITDTTGLRLCMNFIFDSGTRFIQNISFSLWKDDAALESTENGSTLLKSFFVDTMGYPAVATQSVEETSPFIDKLLQEIPYAKIFLKKIRTTDILADYNWFYYYQEEDNSQPWIIQRNICGHNLKARINHFDGHQLVATLEGHPMSVESHIFGEAEMWGDEGKRHADLLLLRFHHILEAVEYHREEILQQYEERKSEITDLVKQQPSRPMEQPPFCDRSYQSNAIEEWYNDLLRPFLFYPVHNGEEIVRYLEKVSRQ